MATCKWDADHLQLQLHGKATIAAYNTQEPKARGKTRAPEQDHEERIRKEQQEAQQEEETKREGPRGGSAWFGLPGVTTARQTERWDRNDGGPDEK
ncbi:unnamed protein product [Calypogeia fissa]